MFSEEDLNQIKEHGLTKESVDYQLQKFKEGFPSTWLNEPALVGAGILKVSEEKKESILANYSERTEKYNMLKFVPASGAATRMFKALFAFSGKYDGSKESYNELIKDKSEGSMFDFFKRLERFAFYEDLKSAFGNSESLEEAHVKREYVAIVNALLEDEGLGYGKLPKGLIKFHQYNDVNRTPVEEHIVEGAQYAKKGNEEVKLHFTVSPDHKSKFEAHINEVRSYYESKYGVSLSVSYSIQKPSTDTIAVDLENNPFRNDGGTILFRPAGHGALLENLNDIEADIVFLKNIDNVVPDKLKNTTIEYKKVIAGLLLDYKDRLLDCYSVLSEDNLSKALDLLNEMGFKPAEDFEELSGLEKVDFLKSKLNRPIRVCGMVQSDGDPGGGPFWIKGQDGSLSLQIVETAQIDLKDENQKTIFNRATHFNPVDVVCYLKDVNGNSFNLMAHRDMETGFITQKSKDGKDLKAQELPGLWNGSMADWNSIFVEVPAITFNPVKSVTDLLKAEHQNEL